MHNIRTQSPTISVNFFGRVVDDAISEAGAGEVSADVISLQVRLTRAPAEGGASSFSITLVPREGKDYAENIRPGDWVRIKAGNAGVADHLLLEGTVDIVGDQQSVGSTGVAQRTITIGGRDWSKVLTNTEMVFDQDLKGVEEGYLTLRAAEWFQQSNGVFLSPTDYIKNLMPLYLGGGAPLVSSTKTIRQFQYPDEHMVKVAGNTTVRTASMAGDHLDLTAVAVTDGAAPVQFYGMDLCLIKLLRYLSHPVLNEFWFETGPVEDHPFRVVLREYPFSRDVFEALDFYSLQEDECMSVSLSRHSAEVYNFFRLRPTGGLGSNTDLLRAARIGYFTRRSINQYGLRRREDFTPFAVFARDSSTDLSKATSVRQRSGVEAVVREWLQKIVTWHCENEGHLQGNFVSRFRPDIRPGRRLSYSNSYDPELSGQFYIDTVTHTFNYPGPSTSSIGVSRGVRDFDDLYTFEQVKDELLLQDLESTALIPSAGVASTASTSSAPASAPASAPQGPKNQIIITIKILKATNSDNDDVKSVFWTDEVPRENGGERSRVNVAGLGVYTLGIYPGTGHLEFVSITNTSNSADNISTGSLKDGDVVEFK